MEVRRWALPLATLVVVSMAGPSMADLALGYRSTHTASAGPGLGSAVDWWPASRELSRTVTLITGDRVVVSSTPAGKLAVSVKPAAGRADIPAIQRSTRHGKLTVIPADAQRLIASGRLDARLFDVSDLISRGYDDRSRSDLPLILQFAGNAQDQRSLRADVTSSGARVTRDLPSIDGVAIAAAKARPGDLWSHITSGNAPGSRSLDAGVAKVWLDGRVRTSLAESVPQIGAPIAWQAGLTGRGVKVAVLDTGIDPEHPDLADAVVGSEDFSDSGSARDGHGHGTHVASIITGSGAASSGRYKGVAPDVELLVGKVLDDQGSGWESAIIDGMEWAAGTDARVVNMSLGGCPTDGTDPMARAVNRLTEQSGALFVIAAGNHPTSFICPDPDHLVSSPASADQALAVGSVTKTGALSDFSNVGPRVGDHAVKPDLTAPGAGIVAARAAGTDNGSSVDQHYTRGSGTSMATPHIAGAAAILAQQHPAWKADEIRSALMTSAVPKTSLSVFQQGAGLVDVARAVSQHVTTSPSSLSMGLARWPHHDDEPISRSLAYRNAGTDALTLDLLVTGTGPDGHSAPDGMFSVTPNRITVPAGGTARVTVTVDTDNAGPDGNYSASLSVTTGTTTAARTPIGVVKEVESYDLSLSAIDRAGRPAVTSVIVTEPTGDRDRLREFFLPGKPVIVRLPKGVYDLASADFTEPEGEKPMITLIGRPELQLGQDTAITLDARAGLRVRAVVDSDTATPRLWTTTWINNGPLRFGLIGGEDPNAPADLYAVPTGPVRSYPYTYGFAVGLTEPEPGSETRNPVRTYSLYLTKQGRVDPVFRVRDRDLAAIETVSHGQASADVRRGRMINHALDTGGDLMTAVGYETRLPGRRLDFYSAGVPWVSWLELDDGSFEGDDLAQRMHSYRPGQRTQRHWNVAAVGPVAGPSFAFGVFWADIGPFTPASSWHVAREISEGNTVRTTLTRNGQLLGTNEEPWGGTFDVPQHQRGDYVLTTRATRQVPWSRLGSKVEAKWSFTAGPFEAGTFLSVLNLRLGGEFDLLDRAPADRPFTLRVTAEKTWGARPQLAELTIRASYDDGRSWRELIDKPTGDSFRVTVPEAPKGTSYISLQASAKDTDGNAVEQTVIRAYALAR